MSERFRVILARHVSDEHMPGTVVGAINEAVWEHSDLAEYEKEVRAIQDHWGNREDYDWREAWVTLDDEALRQVFAEVEIAGEVEA